MNMQPGNKAIVIGAGIGGMAIAIRLAVKGYEVEVFEKNTYPGGKLSFFEANGFQFDAGPSLFTQPRNIEELFQLAGEPIGDYFSYTSLPIACRYFYENGIVVNAYTNPADFAREMKEKLGEKEEQVVKYLQHAERTYEQIGTIFLNHSLHRASTWLHQRIWPALRTVKPGHLTQSLNQFNQQYFTSPEAVQLFNRFATYNGSDPYRAPGMLSLIPHLEHNEGTFYPKGGMISITNALFRLAQKKGVKFHFGKMVQRIIHHNQKAKGVVVDEENYMAQLVVSNMDAYFTYQHLLNNPAKATKVLKQERSSSALIFYWGMSKLFPQLHLHNIFFSKQYKKEFEHIFNTASVFEDPTVYVNITSVVEPAQAPPGKQNWFVMVNVPAHHQQNWNELRVKTREAVILKLSRLLQQDIAPLIEYENYLDPVEIETRTFSYRGSLYGTSSNSRTAAFLRHANFSKTIKGLYFVGGSVHPGGGIPLCLKSAYITDQLIRPADA